MDMQIRAIGGQYLRESMRECGDDDVRETLTSAMRYLGYDEPAIVRVDGGDVYAYASGADADGARGGDGEHPILVASAVYMDT
jgi:hypothetical protein